MTEDDLKKLRAQMDGLKEQALVNRLLLNCLLRRLPAIVREPVVRDLKVLARSFRDDGATNVVEIYPAIQRLKEELVVFSVAGDRLAEALDDQADLFK